MKVLIVEDNIDAAMALAMWLDLEGHVTHQAHSFAAASALDERFDVALIDLSLPDGEGVALAHTVDAARVVAVTGHAKEQVWDACARAGFSHYLRKPVELDGLTRLLAQWSTEDLVA